ncbi:TPA_asm: hypothetical protein GB065_20880 [Salmonella enterica subsp. enterica serovar Mbandaka]|uniref:Uncharacterized protein n=1 Tax=Salmonella enterica subsp. enterica serovar Mbandaka TaxID=192954 RepID=A0A6Y2VWG5_SALET|nr:hypothetical protein [Salmonella enterica subsp. enterica serovar Mbandaka]
MLWVDSLYPALIVNWLTSPGGTRHRNLIKFQAMEFLLSDFRYRWLWKESLCIVQLFLPLFVCFFMLPELKYAISDTLSTIVTFVFYLYFDYLLSTKINELSEEMQGGCK